MLTRTMLIFGLGIYSVTVSGQDDNMPINFSVWAGIEWYLPISEESRWGLFAEGYVKRVDFLRNPQGLFWRLGGSYYLKNGNRLSGGMAQQYNYPYDEAALPYEWSDWRIWQQYMIRKVSPRNDEHLWVHRLRVEERWFARKDDPESKDADDFKFETTFRYMIRSQWYIKPRFAIAVYDELHLRVLSDEQDEKLLDQNRIYGGIVYALDEHRYWRIETGYMFHSMWEAPESIEGRTRINHTWRITLTGDIPFEKTSLIPIYS